MADYRNGQQAQYQKPAPALAKEIKKYRVEMKSYGPFAQHVKSMEDFLNAANADGFNLKSTIQLNAIDIVFVFERR